MFCQSRRIAKVRSFIFALILVGIFLSGTAFCQMRSQIHYPTTTRILLTCNKEGYDSDTFEAYSGGEAGDDVTVYVNGNPIGAFADGLWIKDLNPFLLKGQNTVSLSGKNKNPIYLKVGELNAGDDAKLIEKITLLPDRSRATLSFVSGTSIPQPMADDLKDDPDSIVSYRAEITETLRRFHQDLVNHNGRSAVAFLIEGRKVWQEPAYGIVVTPEYEKQSIAFYNDTSIKVDDFPEKVACVFGKKYALVGSRLAWTMATPQSLFRFSRDNEVITNMKPLIMYKSEASWHVWVDP